MWHGVVQKARRRLLDLLGKDQTKLESLAESIRQQLRSSSAEAFIQKLLSFSFIRRARR
jgi:predicted transcriptional regulator